MLIAFAAVLSLLDSPVQTPTLPSKEQNKNKASTFLFFLFSSHYVSEFLKLFVPHLRNGLSSTENKCRDQLLNVLIRHETARRKKKKKKKNVIFLLFKLDRATIGNFC